MSNLFGEIFAGRKIASTGSATIFGVEIGLQSPVLFQRSLLPATNFIGPNGTISYTNNAMTGNLVAPGVSVNSTINPTTLSGFNFNNGGLNINTTSGTAFSVNGGGIIGVRGSSNAVSSTTGTAFSNADTGLSATIDINASGAKKC